MYKILDNSTIIPTLETERLIMRPFRLSDAAAVFRYSSDPDNTEHMLWEPNRTLADTRKFIREELEKYKTGRDYDYAFILKGAGGLKIAGGANGDKRAGEFGAGELIGTGGASVGEGYFAHTAEIGYILDKRYWGNGYAPEAMRALCGYLFREKGMRRIQAKHFVGNPASGRVMEKIGMKYEGTLVDYLYARGAFQTVKMYAMTGESKK